MPRGPMTEEHKAKMRAGREAAKAARAGVELVDPVTPPVPVEAQAPPVREDGGFNKGKRITFPSHASENANIRTRKIVTPACQVPDVQEYNDKFRTSQTTGPCQQAIVNDKARQFDWVKTCTHGPAFDSEGNAIPEHDRPYYDQGVEYVKRPKSVGTDGRVEWEEFETFKVQLRIKDVSLDIRNNSGNAVMWWAARGARSVESFGVATFCAYRGCFSQDLQQFLNGQFCSRQHAALVKVYELGDILPVAWDRNNQIRPSTERRAKMIREVAV